MKKKLLIITVICCTLLLYGCNNNDFTTNNTHNVGTTTNIAFTGSINSKTVSNTGIELDPIVFLFKTIENFNSFTSYERTFTGTVKTKVAFINYKQTISNYRAKNEEGFFSKTQSNGAVDVLKHTAIIDDVIYEKEAEKVSDNPKWNEIKTYNEISYVGAYGCYPENFTNYVITEETIVSGEYLGIVDGNYRFKYTLDVELSTAQYKVQMRTSTDGIGEPTFQELYLIIDITKDYEPVKIQIYETYKVKIDFLFGAKTGCVAEYVDIFSNINKPVIISEIVDFME